MKTKKILLSCLCVVAIVAATVLGTLAYLTDRDNVVNTFTVGKVEINLDEEKVTPDGNPTPEDDDRVHENNYHLLPGHTYVKDPTMTVLAGSEESYIRMLVSINCYDGLQEIYGGQFLPENFVEGWDSAVWPCVGITVADGVATYEFRYYTTVDGFDGETAADEKLPALFTTFQVPGSFDGDDLAKLEGLKITVTGHAIQKPGFDDELAADGSVVKSAEDLAWAAFDAQMNQP